MELKILDWIQALHNPVTDVLFVWITRLGNVGMIWILLAAVLLLRRKTRKTGDILAAALYLTGERRLWKPALVLGVLIAFSWLYLYVHYPSDILGGVLVGLFAGWAGSRIAAKLLKCSPALARMCAPGRPGGKEGRRLDRKICGQVHGHRCLHGYLLYQPHLSVTLSHVQYDSGILDTEDNGYYEAGHYCLLLADGRQATSRGLFLEEEAKIFEQLGCQKAYNLDGGHCSFMTLMDQVVSHPYKPEHEIPDGIFIMDQTR